jgi:hypothetical protein
MSIGEQRNKSRRKTLRVRFRLQLTMQIVNRLQLNTIIGFASIKVRKPIIQP